MNNKTRAQVITELEEDFPDISKLELQVIRSQAKDINILRKALIGFNAVAVSHPSFFNAHEIRQQSVKNSLEALAATSPDKAMG